MTEGATTEPVNLVDLIEQLVSPSEPPAISMVPQTAGWIVLAVGLASIAGLSLWRWHRHHKANAYRRAALAELDRVGSDPVAIAEILRRTALTAYPRTEVAALCGADWLGFLDATVGGTAFREGQGRIVAEAPYHPGLVGSVALRDLATQWIRHHRREAAS
ncbi:DUF4381 domain-containing protein [Parasedimentitalea psychrophila]|uniref:DUF4381 domain-containing protein n=1 Tax=Parasedimentitalea psychrophila TaxID=2997337 RepID=A0A9Y2KZT7_9RHOB|nr:DUF4381 domain-containing protein [Parasedimentitalea psychrophila]WIY26096.1 DUF4381 domain-containing protein [Parasedimentitalea psychrophila]